MAWDHEAHDGEPDSSDSLRTFGAVVQALREHAGLSREDLAALVGYSKHTVASVELGRRMPYPDFIEGTEAATGNTGALKRAARYLSRQPGLASWFRKWALLEREAISLYTYESRLVPGLLQTEAYARVLFGERLPPLTDEQLESQISARLERQKLLTERPNTSYSFIVEEHVFLRRTGGPEVTRELIDHVLACVKPRNVQLQIMPLERGVHAGLNGPIQLLETPTNRWFGYCEGQESGQFISDPQVISTLHMRYAKLRSQAMTYEESVGLLEQLRGAL
ncbi:helix-turn-helix domain-containing protein [Streptomyces violascens]|uniref:Transcriptional regulator n=1 Tax=Streptomyces violascens TaxID=67381 RepID=A0ABQ3QQH1_9ACTN|nr:helix-turn-helix transcriptional regulator [Streptomyces violascens]GGU20727.1 transcriptional regulator [Streptomyces violascens]GHI39526.1 transcriptional regulator [Streptomyces violascens]